MKKSLLIFSAIIFSFLFSFAHSETIPATETEQWSASFGSGLYASDTAACQYMLGVFISQGYQLSLGGITVISPSEHSCRWLDKDGNPAYGDSVYKLASVLECPSGYTKSGSFCTREDCSAGSIRLPDGSCGRDCNALKNTDYSGYIPASANPAVVCQEGCGASVKIASNQASVDGQPVIAGTFTYNGSSCSGNNITAGTPPTCPPGQCVGLINGANACFTCSSLGQTASTYESTSDTTVKTTTYNSDGSTTTSIADISSGTTSSPSTTQKPEQQTYCEQNPTAITCLESDSPNVPEPDLENIQSGFASFQIIKNMVQIQPTNFSHSSQCPTSSFSWNGHAFYFDAHCTLIQNHWSALSAAMLAAWTVLSLFVVLKA